MSHSEIKLHIIKTGFYNSQFVYKQQTQSPERKVEYYELEFFPECGGISYINKQPYPIVQGNVLLAVPGYYRYSSLPFKAFYIHFITENAELQNILNNLPPISVMGSSYLKIEQLFKQVIQHVHYEDTLHFLFAESKLLELIFHLSNKTTSEKIKSAYSPIVLQALEYVDRNFKEDIILEDIANAVGLTPVYLHKLILKNTGKTPHQILLQKRLDTAKELLSGSDMSLVNIAIESGFSSQSYFNAVFKKTYDMTPLEFRQNAYLKYRL